MLPLLCGGVCHVAGQHSFFYEGRIPHGGGHIPVMGLGGISSPFLVYGDVAVGGPCVCGYLYCGIHMVPRISTCGCMEWIDRV